MEEMVSSDVLVLKARLEALENRVDDRMNYLGRMVADSSSQTKALREQLAGIATRLENGAEKLAVQGEQARRIWDAIAYEKSKREELGAKVEGHEKDHRTRVSLAVTALATVGASCVGAIVAYLLH